MATNDTMTDGSKRKRYDDWKRSDVEMMQKAKKKLESWEARLRSMLKSPMTAKEKDGWNLSKPGRGRGDRT